MDFTARVREALAGRYAVERPLGRGGTATVFLAEDLRHHREVAIKVLDPELAVVIGAERFMREIEIAARLQHPHILPLLDSGTILLSPETHATDPGVPEESRWAISTPTQPTVVPYYVMPYVQGESLRDRLEREHALPPGDAIRIAREVADALDYAHRQGVVHRDVKPENILLSGGHAVVADFGIARALGEAGGERLTRAGVSLGTPQYMAPEQIVGTTEADGRVDLYALGCVLFEMLVGAAPFAGGTVQAMLARRLAEPPPRVRTTGAHVSPAIEEALRRAMATDPGARFSSAGEFAAALGDPATFARSARSQRLRSGAVVAVPLVLVGALLFSRFVSRADRGAGRGPITTLAIRPLVNTDQDSTTQYLSEGIHEAVADLLRRLPDLSITAPSLVAEILAQNPTLDLRELGQRLRVGAVLTWNMRRLGDSLHLRAELVSTADGRILWGQTYNRPFADIFAIQSDIARTISDSLRLRVSGAEAGKLTRQPTRDAVAYDLYLRGRHVWLKATPLGSTGAMENADSIRYYAERTLARDPNFAGGHFLLGGYYSIVSVRGWREPFGRLFDSARVEARRAIELDSTFADAWMLLGTAPFYTDDDWDHARAYLSRAVRLNPTLPDANIRYGIVLAEVDRQLDSAIVHMTRAVEAEPQGLVYYNSLGDVYMRARRWDSAVSVLGRAIAIDPSAPGPRNRLIRSLEELGRYSDAIAVRRKARDPAGAEAFARAFAKDGAAGYRRALVEELRGRIASLLLEVGKPHPVWQDTIPPLIEGRIAALYARLGEWPKAMDWVLREHQRRPKRFRLFVTNPDFDGLRNDPRYLPLVRKEGLESLLPR